MILKQILLTKATKKLHIRVPPSKGRVSEPPAAFSEEHSALAFSKATHAVLHAPFVVSVDAAAAATGAQVAAAETVGYGVGMQSPLS